VDGQILRQLRHHNKCRYIVKSPCLLLGFFKAGQVKLTEVLNESITITNSVNEVDVIKSVEQLTTPLPDDPAFDVLLGQSRTSDPKWLLVEEGFTLDREHEIESLFSIANGYVGTRGSLAEGCALSAPATFVAGVFEQLDRPGSVPELMTLPDWTSLRIWIDDQPLSMQHGELMEHRRILDLHRGIFWREWRQRDPEGRITRIVAFRLASLVDRPLAVSSVRLTAENHSSLVTFESDIELASCAVPLLSPDWKAESNCARPNVVPLAMRPSGRDTVVAMSLSSQVLNSASVNGRRALDVNERHLNERCEVRVAVGMDCQLDRLISIYTSRSSIRPFERVMRHLKGVIRRGVPEAVTAHVAEWESRSRDTDIEVEGDDAIQKALRFAGYHLIAAANPDDGRVSIGARALTGAAYKGHVFWDTEIYMLPFYIFTHPPSARTLLEYRYHTLNAARDKARAFGFRGAMFPWESADTGEEVTPRTVIAPNGEVLNILNGQLEVHITADIAFAVWQYWQAVGDDEFLLLYGAEIMQESARFWASRGTMEAGTYHIRHVIGPDEYHPDVDDNAYTNLMAAWNLRTAARTACLLQQRWPERWRELAARLQITDNELKSWEQLADRMFTGFCPETLLFEQFSGYFNKEEFDLKSVEPRSAAMDLILGHERVQQTNIVKQADVALAMYLLWDEFGSDVHAANYRYYEPRTGHGSSLSPSIYALIAARLGDHRLAQRYLNQAAEIDLGNNMGNAAGGVHAAALGGLWQAVVFGVAGVKTRSNGLSFAPNLLPRWHRLTFPFKWHGCTLRVSIDLSTIHVSVRGTNLLKLGLAGGPEIDAEPEKQYVAERTELGWKPWRVSDFSDCG